MISSPRHVLKTPDIRPNVTDLGNYLTIGSNLFTKSLIPVGFDRLFEPVNTHGNTGDLSPYLYGYRRVTTPFQFKGTNCPNTWFTNGTIETSLSAQSIGGGLYSLGQQVSAVNCCAAPSSMTPDLQSPSNFKYYYPVVDNSNATPLSIRRVRVPQTLGSYTTPTASDVTVCSFVGTPSGFTIPNPNAFPTTGTSLAECDLLTINSNGSEYIVVINHAMVNNPAGTNTNGCTSDRHIVAVFMVDPTDSTKLIYQSHLTPANLGSSMVYGALNTNVDRTLIVLSNNGGFIALKWNPAAANFIVSKYYGVSNISRISVDELDQIWIESTDGSLYVFQLDNSVNVEVTFVGNAQTVNYTGTNITIDAIVNAYTLEGVRASKQVTLTVEGAVFTASGTNTAVVTTSTTADTLVNITISAAGAVILTPTSVV